MSREEVQEQFLDDLETIHLDIMKILHSLKINPKNLGRVIEQSNKSKFLSTIFNDKIVDNEYIYLNDIIEYFEKYPNESRIMKEINRVIPILTQMKQEILKEEKKVKKLTETIKKQSDGYHVVSHKGKSLSGPYNSKEEAEKRLKQVEYFKHKKESIQNKKIESLTKLLEKYSGKKVELQEMPLKYTHVNKHGEQHEVDLADKLRHITATLENLGVDKAMEEFLNSTSKLDVNKPEIRRLRDKLILIQQKTDQLEKLWHK